MGMFLQIQTAFSCATTSLVMGLLSAWPSYTLPQYTSPNTTLIYEPMTTFYGSLLSSLPCLGAMLGTAVSSQIIDRIGRKRGGVVLCLPYVLSWAMIEVTKSSLLILIARFVAGIAGGASLVYAPIFISEIADDSIRGTLTAVPIIFFNSGVLLSYLLGWKCNYSTINYINLAASVFSAVLVGLVTESPVYLLKNNRDNEALQALADYRGLDRKSKLVQEQFSRLKQQVSPAVEMITVCHAGEDMKTNDPEKEKLKKEEIVYEDRAQISPLKLLFTSTAARRALTVVGLALTLQVFVGMITIQVYSNDVFTKVAPDLSPDLCSILFAIIVIVGGCVTAAFADKAGRKILMLSSCVLVSICMTLLGTFLLLQVGLNWFAIMVVLVFCFSFSFGAGTVPYVLLAECFNTEVQGIASMLLIEWIWFLNFAIIALFPYAVAFLELYGVFYFYSVMGFVCFAVSYYTIPETKGLSKDQIYELFLRKSSI